MTTAAPRKARKQGGSLASLVLAGAFLGPAVLLVVVWLLVPFIVTVWTSITADPSPAVVGHYLRFASDPALGRSVVNTVLWTVGTLILPVGIGLLVATLTAGERLGSLMRTAFVIPYAMSGTATAVVWGFILRSDGALDQALAGIGLESLSRSWLLEWPTNTIVMIVANTWQAVGVAIILFTVGLRGLPPETLEAARLDGASGWRLFALVVFPQLRHVTVVVIGMSIANSLRVFDLIWLLTRGGPGSATETLAVTMYRNSFILNDAGYGAALAVLLSLIVVTISFAYLRNQMPERA